MELKNANSFYGLENENIGLQISRKVAVFHSAFLLFHTDFFS